MFKYFQYFCYFLFILNVTSLDFKPIYNLKINRLPQNLQKIKTFQTTQELPANIDLRNKFPDIFDQGQLGSCTANALTALISYNEPNFIGSRLFLYYNERNMEGTTSTDAGARITDGIIALEKLGICSEEEWAYDISKFAIKPPDSCYESASKNVVLEAFNVHQDINSIKTALINNHPFAVGIYLYSSFESKYVFNTGLVPYPRFYEKLVGGHAVVCC
jgi:C1A family cysteine protease